MLKLTTDAFSMAPWEEALDVYLQGISLEEL
jgi:hypothetical protein